jgi:hypothetical protein
MMQHSIPEDQNPHYKTTKNSKFICVVLREEMSITKAKEWMKIYEAMKQRRLQQHINIVLCGYHQSQIFNLKSFRRWQENTQCHGVVKLL